MALLSTLSFLLLPLLLSLSVGAVGVDLLRPSNWTGPVLRVAAFQHTTGRFEAYGAAYRTVFQMFQVHVGRIGGILTFSDNRIPLNAQVEFALIDIGGATWEQMKANVVREAARVHSGAYGNFSAVIAPYSSELTPLVANEIQDLPVFAPGAAARSVFLCNDAEVATGKCFNRTSGRRFPNLFGTLAPASHYPQLAMQLARFRQAKVALVLENTTFGREVCQAARELAVQYNLTVVGTEVYSNASVAALARLQPDFVFGCMYADTCRGFLGQLGARQASFNATVLTSCVGDPATQGPSRAFVMGPSQWHPGLADETHNEQASVLLGFMQGMFPVTAQGPSSPEQFRQAYRNAAGTDPTYHAASALASLYLFQRSMLMPKQSSPARLMEEITVMSTIGLPTFYGALSLDQGSGMLSRAEDFALLQYDSTATTSKIVYPMLWATAEAEYPAPTFEQRTCRNASPVECSGHGVCQRDGACLCYTPFIGTLCDEQSKVKVVTEFLERDGCLALYISSSVLFGVFAMVTAMAVWLCCTRREARRLLHSLRTAAPVSLGGQGPAQKLEDI